MKLNKILFAIVFGGMILFTLSLPLIKDIATLESEVYQTNASFYSDRNYHTDTLVESFNNGLIIKQYRHANSDIVIENPNGEQLRVYRVLSESNNNEAYTSWNDQSDSVLIQGEGSKSTILKYIDTKDAIINLKSGGPICSDPLLIKGNTDGLSYYYYSGKKHSVLQKVMRRLQ